MHKVRWHKERWSAVGISVVVRAPNIKIRQKTMVDDVGDHITRLKLRWAWHLADYRPKLAAYSLNYPIDDITGITFTKIRHFVKNFGSLRCRFPRFMCNCINTCHVVTLIYLIIKNEQNFLFCVSDDISASSMILLFASRVWWALLFVIRNNLLNLFKSLQWHMIYLPTQCLDL